jgi:uncharacterized membrane protein
MTRHNEGRTNLYVGGVLIGVGLGGFVDGIVFHQIFQWHHMLSSVIPPTTMAAMELNMVWDGLFHVLVWLATFVGVLLLWSGARRLPSMPGLGLLLGLLLVGWGIFNLVEGTVNHHILGIHHVRGYGPNLAYDLSFLATGLVFLVAGALIARASLRAHDRAQRSEPPRSSVQKGA